MKIRDAKSAGVWIQLLRDATVATETAQAFSMALDLMAVTLRRAAMRAFRPGSTAAPIREGGGASWTWWVSVGAPEAWLMDWCLCLEENPAQPALLDLSRTEVIAACQRCHSTLEGSPGCVDCGGDPRGWVTVEIWWWTFVEPSVWAGVTPLVLIAPLCESCTKASKEAA